MRMRLPSRSAQIRPTSRSGAVVFLTVASVLGGITQLDEPRVCEESSGGCQIGISRAMIPICALALWCSPFSRLRCCSRWFGNGARLQRFVPGNRCGRDGTSPVSTGAYLMWLLFYFPPDIGPELLDHQRNRVVAHLRSPNTGRILQGAVTGYIWDVDAGLGMVAGVGVIAVG